MSRQSYDSEPRGRRTHGRKSRRRKKKRFPVLIIILLIIAVAAIAIGTEVLNHFAPTKEKADLEELYGASEGHAGVILDHHWSEESALWQDGRVYLAYDSIRRDLNGRFFWDSSERKLLYTMPEETLVSGMDASYEGAPVIVEQDGVIYISLAYVESCTNVVTETFMDPARVVIETTFAEEDHATVAQDGVVRVKGGIKSPIITEVPTGTDVVLLEEFENWMQVQTPDGWIGFIEKEKLGETFKVVPEKPDREPIYTSISAGHPVCMVWQQSLNSSCINQLNSLIASDAITSVNTVSPTWFTITDSVGGFSSRASSEYTSTAHENGLDVWPVLDNVNEPNVDMIQLLQNTENRNTLIRGVMEQLEASGADGLNVDLEYIPQEAADGYIQFIRELSVECRKRSLILSVDNIVPSAWSDYYNRREQGVVADYVVIMGYDEHYNGSEIGSTASLPYVEEGIVNTIAQVPAEKVINGVPFYSRLWKESLTSVDSEAIGMDGMREFAAKYNAEASWDSECAQNYVRVEDGEMIYQLWLEDAESMESRLQMMSGYNLGGVACWKQGMESSDIWSVFSKYYGK